MENPNQNSLNKNHFPKLLQSLLEKIQLNQYKNIKSGFKATGISPFNPREVLKRLPEYQEDLSSFGIDNALLEYLKRIRQPNPMNIRRNIKIITEPGKSVTVSDFMQAPNSNGLHPSKSSVRDRVKPSNNKTRVTKQKRDTRDQFDNFNENVNYEKEYILNEKTGLMEITENTDVVHEAELSVIANRDQDRPKKVVVLSDINLSKKNCINF